MFGDPAQVSAHLIASPVIRVITFTGSIAVGKHLTQLAAKEMKPAIMELGGHAPVIVCDDVDPVRVGHLAGAAKFRMAGQICVSPTRFIVHEAIYAPFVKAFAEAAGALKVGDGMAGGVQMGPMANGRRLAAIEELVEEAVACGARVASGGKRIGDRGFFYAPTVLADVPRTARAMSVSARSPPEREPNDWSARRSIPKSASTSHAARRSAAEGVRRKPTWGVRPITAMSSAVNGKVVFADCGTYATRRARSRALSWWTGTPAMAM